MEFTGRVIMRSIARSFNLHETFFDKSFEFGISTLRFLHYHIRDKNSYHGKENEFKFSKGYSLGVPHIDSGFITLLAQDKIGRLQAKINKKNWIDVPPIENSITLNFGRLLEQWTENKIKATIHRVIGYGQERFSIPFFFEPGINTVIKPINNSKSFQPFLYGDWLWDVTTNFVEQNGIRHLRKSKG